MDRSASIESAARALVEAVEPMLPPAVPPSHPLSADHTLRRHLGALRAALDLPAPVAPTAGEGVRLYGSSTHHGQGLTTSRLSALDEEYVALPASVHAERDARIAELEGLLGEARDWIARFPQIGHRFNLARLARALSPVAPSDAPRPTPEGKWQVRDNTTEGITNG